MWKEKKGFRRWWQGRGFGLVEVAAIAAIVGVIGCATVRLPDNPTPEQVKTAKDVDCAAAEALIVESDRMLVELSKSDVLDQDAINYWTLARSGASLGMAAAGCTPSRGVAAK